MAKRIMIVDDSRVVELQMKKMLEGTDYEVVSYCQDGETAIAQYGEVRPDLVTMDIIMPGMDGLETARAILEEHPEAKIIMVSSLAYDDTIEEAETIGTKTFIYKPLEKEQLLSALDEVMKDDGDGVDI